MPGTGYEIASQSSTERGFTHIKMIFKAVRENIRSIEKKGLIRFPVMACKAQVY